MDLVDSMDCVDEMYSLIYRLPGIHFPNSHEGTTVTQILVHCCESKERATGPIIPDHRSRDSSPGWSKRLSLDGTLGK